MGCKIVRRLAFLSVAAACALTAGFAAGQTYPAKPIRLIAPFPPGGSSDILARILGQKIGEAWRQRIVVDNRPGASGSIGTGIAAGLPGFVLDNWWGLLTPRGVSPKIIDRLNAAIVQSLKQPDVIARYTALGIESVTSTPQAFTNIIKSDQAKYVKVIKDAGIVMEP